MSEPKAPDLKTLSRSEIFFGVPQTELADLVKRTRILDAKPGETLFAEGDVVQGMYVIIDGAVGVLRGSTVIAELKATNFFGEISLFGQSLVATATIQVKTPARMLFITRPEMDAWLKSHALGEARFLRNLVTELCNRLCSTTDQYVMLQNQVRKS